MSPSSRYFEALQILQNKLLAKNIFKLVYNEDKETYSLPYLYENYKNNIEPIKISNKIVNSIKEYLDQNLYSLEEKKLLLSELFRHIDVFGNDIISYLNNRIQIAEKLEYNDSKYVEEYKKTIIALNQINKIINNELTLFYASLTYTSLDENFKQLKMKSKKDIAEIILEQFRKSNSRANHIVMWRTYSLSIVPKLNPKEQDLFFIVVNELVKDGYLIYEDARSGPECLRLTDKGYERIYDDEYYDKIQPIEVETTTNLSTVVILTAIKEEYLAVRKHLKNIEEISVNDTHYESGIFELNNKEIAKIIIRECGAKNTIASQETERAIQYFKPECMLFVGIAGSRKKNDFIIGDVIFPEKIYSYEAGKSEKESFKARPDLADSNYVLLEIAKKERRKDDWKNLIKGIYDRNVSANLGIIASGEQIIEHYDSEIGKILTEHFNDTSAVEMEGFGFAKAATRQGRQTNNILVGVIRGISDVLENRVYTSNENIDKRPNNAKEFASDTASAFAFWLIYQLYNKQNANT